MTPVPENQADQGQRDNLANNRVTPGDQRPAGARRAYPPIGADPVLYRSFLSVCRIGISERSVGMRFLAATGGSKLMPTLPVTACAVREMARVWPGRWLGLALWLLPGVPAMVPGPR